MWLNIKIVQFEFIVTKFDHIVNHIIPFFDKYNIKGAKYGDLFYFKSDACIIKNKEHLNQDGAGLKKILLLKTKNKDINIAKKNHMYEQGFKRKWIKKGGVNLHLVFKGRTSSSF